MPGAAVYKKRPCGVCRRWFRPNPRLKERQKTCGDAQCKREWHRRKCAAWNKRNPDYFKSNYLDRKLKTAALAKKPSGTTRPGNRPPPLPFKTPLSSGLPFRFVQELIGIQHLVIIEYSSQHLLRRFQDALKRQVVVMTGKTDPLPRLGCSRCDRL
jgi:hypothetical protein